MSESTMLDVAWRRAGQARFHGALYEPTRKIRTSEPYRTMRGAGLAWLCEHGHATKEEATACAEAELTSRQERITDGSE